MSYPGSKIEDFSLLEITTTDDGTEEFSYKTEKDDHENILKSFNYDNEFFKKKCVWFDEQKIILIGTVSN